MKTNVIKPKVNDLGLEQKYSHSHFFAQFPPAGTLHRLEPVPTQARAKLYLRVQGNWTRSHILDVRGQINGSSDLHHLRTQQLAVLYKFSLSNHMPLLPKDMQPTI